MSSSDEVPPSEDPDFAALFRQAPSAELTHLDAPAPEPVEPAGQPEAPAAAAESMIDTGRLFRSQGVKGNDSAVLALSTVQGLRLRTLKRTDAEPPAAAALPPESLTPESAAMAASAGVMSQPPQPEPSEPRPGRRARGRRAAGASSGAGLPALTCYMIIIGVTLIVAFINAFLSSGDIGWPTGLAMLAATVYCALKVRREDDIVPVITPALAFFLTSITAAQLFLGSAERSLLNRGVVVFFTLADNWMWIIGTTVVALVIMIVRRRRA